MQRSAQRRGPTSGRRNRRVIALAAAVVVFGGIVTVTQVSDAASRRFGWGRPPQQQAQPCPTTSTTRRWDTRRDLATSQNGRTETHNGDGQTANSGRLEREARQRGRQNQDRNCTPSSPATTPSNNNGGGNNGGGNNGGGNSNRVAVPPGGADGANNGLQVLGRDCTNSRLDEHDGFQNAPRCSETMMGEVPAADDGATLLITEHPDEVGVNQPFSITVSTRNLQRDRFLGAGAGGYYLESSFLNEEGIVRGHFHTACRRLASLDEAPDPEPAPEFFVATEDGVGGREPDSVQINIPGLPTAGTYQCSSWAGDGSHRLPMQQRANQTPAFDSFRLEVQ